MRSQGILDAGIRRLQVDEAHHTTKNQQHYHRNPAWVHLEYQKKENFD